MSCSESHCVAEEATYGRNVCGTLFATQFSHACDMTFAYVRRNVAAYVTLLQFLFFVQREKEGRKEGHLCVVRM